MSDSDDGEWVFVRRASETERLGGFAVEPSERNLKVLFAGPAKYWTDAIPIGNGRLGAMVWGGVQAETIQLNHDTLWTGVPGDYTNPQAPAVLSKVRQLVDDAKYAEATKEAFGLSGDPSDVYQPLGDIKVDFDDYHEPYSTYERELDLDTATAKIKYTIGDTEFTREHYASNPHQVIVTRISANKPSSLFFTVYLDSKLHHSSTANSATRIIMEGTCPGHRRRPKLAASENPNPKGIQFSAILDLKISPDAGTVSILEGRKLRVEGADWAVLLLAASSSFDGPFTMPVDSKKDPVSVSIAIMNSLTNLSFRQLYAYHLDDYQELFRRVTLQLSASSNNEQRESRQVESNEFCRKLGSRNSTEIRFHEEKMYHSSKDSETEKMINDTLVPTAERVKSFKSDEDPSFVELLFQYGRYLLISCSRPGTQVANLQGIWNKDVEPAWDAAPHLNINLQMNYWPSLPCNLSECQLPLFDYISSLAVNGSKTAKVNYETSGWVAHQVSDVWAKTSPDRGDPVWALWPMGGAWLCTHLWEHYSFSMDREFLKNTAYPLMKGCASFLLDWLIEGNGGLLETNPSTSPEHSFVAPDGQTASVSYSSTMDISIIKEIFSIVLFASEVLGRNDDDLVKKIRKAMPRLPPIRIARDGTIMEWAQDFQDPDIHHRHVSHLFGLFPGHTISIQKTPDLCKAAENSLYKRGDVGPGWSTTWKMALWARLHNSEHAYRLIKQLIILVDPEHESDFEGGLYSNLFTAHPPFQIDANFGFPAAITEMLVQSTEQDLYLLPALPRDKWRSGCVNGLKARGGVTVNICWKEGGLHETRLWSMNQNSVRRLHYNGIVSIVTVSYGKTYAFDKQLKFLRVQSHA